MSRNKDRYLGRHIQTERVLSEDKWQQTLSALACSPPSWLCIFVQSTNCGTRHGSPKIILCTTCWAPAGAWVWFSFCASVILWNLHINSMKWWYCLHFKEKIKWGLQRMFSQGGPARKEMLTSDSTVLALLLTDTLLGVRKTKAKGRTSLVVYQLGLTAKGMGSIPGWGTKISKILK